MNYFESEGLVLKSGSLAYYDTTFGGLVPCKVLTIKDRGEGFHFVHKAHTFEGCGSTRQRVTFQVTADHGAWHKGEILEASGIDVCPRRAIRRHKYSTTIRAYQVQCDA